MGATLITPSSRLISYCCCNRAGGFAREACFVSKCKQSFYHTLFYNKNYHHNHLQHIKRSKTSNPSSSPLIINYTPSYSSSIYSREEYNTLKWRSESIVDRNSVHSRKKISVLKISAEVCGLIFLLWEITCEKTPYVLQNKRHTRPAPHALWHHGKLVFCSKTKNYINDNIRRDPCH